MVSASEHCVVIAGATPSVRLALTGAWRGAALAGHGVRVDVPAASEDADEAVEVRRTRGLAFSVVHVKSLCFALVESPKT